MPRIEEISEAEAKEFEMNNNPSQAVEEEKEFQGARVQLPETKEDIEAFLQSMPLLGSGDHPEFQQSDEFVALQTMIEESSPEDRVQAFKDGGNKAISLGAQYLALSKSSKEKKERLHEFKEESMKRLEDGILYYTQALGVPGCDNKVLLSILYSNRALGHLHLKQYGHCKGDAAQAIRLNSYNLKAYFRAATAFRALKQLEEGLKLLGFGLEAAERWAELSTEDQMNIRKMSLTVERRDLEKNVGLNQNNWFEDEKGEPVNMKTLWAEFEKQMEQQVTQLKTLHKAMKDELEKEKAKEVAKQLEKQRLQQAEESKRSLWKMAIQQRKLRIGPPSFLDHSAGSSQARKTVAADYSQQGFVDEKTGEMHWPVFFLYPEVMQSDFVSDFAETTTFRQHLEQMFPPKGSSPVWDKKGHFTLGNLTLEYEVSVEEGLRTLAQQLKKMRQERGQPPHEDSKEALLKMLPIKPSDLQRDEKCVKMQISIDTKLIQVVSAPGYVIPGIPTFMIRAKN